MIPFLALAAAGLLPESKVPRPHPPAHRARANLASYFGDADYPADALHRHEQGVVGFTLDVNAAGRVGACRITESSGSAALDDATCRIARERAQFTPALDRRGRPVPDRIASRIRWVLPEPDPSDRARANLASYISDSDYPVEAIRAGEQGVVGFELEVGPDGRVADCRIVTSSNSASLDAATCRIMTSRARFRPARDSSGDPTVDRVSARVRWELPADEPASADEADLSSYISSADYPAEAIAQRMEGRVDVLLSVSPAGRVDGCKVIQTGVSRSAALDARTCEIVRARASFIPARNEAGQAIQNIVLGYVRWALPTP
jgi:TonB family protein